MKPLRLKLRLIYYPFLLIAAGFILLYSLLNVWLTIETTTISLKEDVTDLWIPLCLPFVLLFIWLRGGIKILNLKSKRAKDPTLLYLLVAGGAIALPNILLQSYLRSATGKKTSLQSISHIRENKLTKYYTAKSFYIDTSLASVENDISVSGKRSEYLDFSFYIACPMFDRKPATSEVGHLLPQAWACVKYTERISSRLSKSAEEEKWEDFVRATADDFSHKDLSHLVYLERLGNTDDRDNYEKAIISNRHFNTIPGPLLILEPRFTAFETRTGNKLGWVFGSFGIGALVCLIMVVIPKLDESVLEDGEEGLSTLKKGVSGNDFKELGAILLPRQGFFAIPILLDLNLLVFILMVFAGKGFINFQAADLVTWGANFRPLTAGAGQWWRLLTSIFLHGGIMHLLFNMAGLLFAGYLLEPALGKTRLAIVYLLTGTAASLTSLWWHSATVSVGASGAIFGLYGVFLALLTTRYFPPVIKRAFTISVLIFVGGNLLMGLAGGIDNAAHIGGLISGLVAGYIVYPRLKTEKESADAAMETVHSN